MNSTFGGIVAGLAVAVLFVVAYFVQTMEGETPQWSWTTYQSDINTPRTRIWND